ncbi:MAG: polymerase subunit sigma-24 [Candidatus Nomurabacteria bacterium]|nr:polymerase subunit sigma-24 [Candidatus Nomurabacteria bacterium]
MLMEYTDEQLIERYQNGDQSALVTLTTRYFDTIYRYTYRFARDRAATEDIVQDTFIKVWKSIARFDKSMKVKPWLYRIAHNTAIDYLRKKKMISFSSMEGEQFEETIADEAVGTMEQAIAAEERAVLTQKIESLPTHYKEVLLLRAEESLTFEEISIALSKPLNTIKSLYRRALLLLQK